MTEEAVVSEFSGHAMEPEWDRAYVQAIEQVQYVRGVVIRDLNSAFTAAPGGYSVKTSVLMRVIRSSDVGRAALRDAIQADCDRQITEGIPALGLAVFGDGGQAARTMYEYVGEAPRPLFRWIDSAADLGELRTLLTGWLLLLVDLLLSRRPHVPTSESVLASELPETTAGTTTMKGWGMEGIP